MCTTCGCATPEEPSGVERVKAASNGLRGSLASELEEDTTHFGDDAGAILKFHGVYQQDDRDRRKEARKLGLDKLHSMMIRTKVPGGIVSAEAYLAHDRVAGEWGNDTMRITTRQDFQLHGVLKGDLRRSIRAINEALLTTFGGCGDQVRNVMACPLPADDPLRASVNALLPDLVRGLTPTTHAYVEIWLDGDLAASAEPEPAVDELYGQAYLPRKFKVAVAIEGDNCIDVHANDLGLVARADGSGSLEGFDVLVGGGLGRTANKPRTRPHVSVPLGFVGADRVIEVARAVVAVQRDHGDRVDRRHARLKYLIADRGVDWFREQVEAAVGPLAPSRPLRWESAADHLGWGGYGDGPFHYGIFVENGRVEDRDGHRLRTALRELVAELRCEVRLTAQQNLLLCGLRERDRTVVVDRLRAHGITPSEEVPTFLAHAMACPAYPTCGLAVAESERVMPALVRQIGLVQVAQGLADQPISYRMTGCPNGCARPYLGDVGMVGTTLGKYDVFLGGDFEGTRLNELYAHNVRLEDIPDVLAGPLAEYARTRQDGEGFGDWCHRTGVGVLAERLEREVVTA